MSKQDVVSQQLQAMQAAEVDAATNALGACFDAGLAEGQSSGGSGGGFTQADIDAAVLAQKNADDAALAEAQAAAQTALQGVQDQLNAMTAKEQLEESAVAGLQSAVGSLQAALDTIKGIVLPPPPASPPSP